MPPVATGSALVMTVLGNVKLVASAWHDDKLAPVAGGSRGGPAATVVGPRRSATTTPKPRL